MPGHLQRRRGQLAGQASHGAEGSRLEPGSRPGGVGRRPGQRQRQQGRVPGRPGWWQEGRQVWGAWLHPHRKQGAPGAASVGGSGGTGAQLRAGGVAGGLGKALLGWPHLHNKRAEMEALVQRAIYKIQSQPLLAPPAPCPALPFPLGLRSPPPRQSPAPPCPAWPDHMALAGSPCHYQPAKAAGSCHQMRAGFPAPESFRSWERGPEVLAACPHRGRPGHPGVQPGRGGSLSQEPPPGAPPSPAQGQGGRAGPQECAQTRGEVAGRPCSSLPAASCP